MSPFVFRFPIPTANATILEEWAVKLIQPGKVLGGSVSHWPYPD